MNLTANPRHPVEKDIWDAIVIGAGPAGAAAALELARRRKRVLLVERQSFPRYKVCGGCVNHQALSLLASLGLESRIAALEGVPLARLNLHHGRQTLSLPLAGGRAMLREPFDLCLVQEAIEQGATFVSQTTALVRPEEMQSVRCVDMRENGGGIRQARARLVLVAGGLSNNSLRLLPEFASQACAGSRVGVGATTAEYPGFYEPGTVAMAIGSNGYVGLTHCAPGVLNVAAALDPGFLRSHGHAAAAIAAILHEARLPAISSLESVHWHGTVALTRHAKRVAGTRLFLLGDAAGYVEPFTGEGIAWALASAAAVTPLAMEGIDQWRDDLVRQWECAHREAIRRRQHLCRALAYLLRHPRLGASLLHAFAWFPSLANLLVERAHGRGSRQVARA
jgi:flavin-dependent dehydrogenase